MQYLFKNIKSYYFNIMKYLYLSFSEEVVFMLMCNLGFFYLRLLKNFKEFIDKEEYDLRKRLLRKLSKRKIDVYIIRKIDFVCQLERVQKLLDLEYEVYVYGFGVVINRVINLVLQI